MGSTVGTIKDLEPKSLTLGATTTIIGSGSLTQDVPGGDFSFTAKALGVTVLSDSGDLCADKSIALPLGVGTFDYKSAGCPIKAGDVALTFDATLAGSIPSQIAKLDIEIDAKATDGTKALCAEINTSPGENFKQSSAGGKVDLAFSDCGDASTVGTIKDLEPKSLTLGATTTIIGSGSLTQDVPGGDFSFTAKALGVTVLSDSGDLCADKSIALPLGVGTFDYKSAGCPLKAGDVSLTFDATLAGAIPSQIARLDISVTATGSDGTKALCANIHTTPGLGAMDQWSPYKQEWNKVYNGDEDQAHKATFEQNLAEIEAHNAQGLSWTEGINRWTDLTQDEYRVAAGLGYKAPEELYGNMPQMGVHEYNGEELALEVDWTTKGAVTPVKDQ